MLIDHDTPHRFRAASVEDALASLASVFGAPPASVCHALPNAVAEVNDVLSDRDLALVEVLSHRLGALRTPERIHYFHGTRLIEPDLVRWHGLLPHDQVLSLLWRQLGELARRHVTTSDWRAFRTDMTAGLCGPPTYLRPAVERGPYGLLVRDVFLDPEGWHSVDYLDAPEAVADICQAAQERFGIDLASFYRQQAIPCIVEFAVRSVATYVEEAVASPAWFVESASRGEHPLDALHSFDGHGTPVPAGAIVAIDATDRAGRS
jgi:hypothetical protein